MLPRREIKRKLEGGRWERNEMEKKDLVDKIFPDLRQEVSKSKNYGKESSPIDAEVHEIFATVKRLEQRVSRNQLGLQSDADYLKSLYIRVINENIENLKFFDYKGKRIPYVLVDSVTLEGIPGRVFNNLYFVAHDKAPEEWQQQIIAYHESLCVRIGHEKAKKEECTLAKYLGIEGEYLKWREEIDCNNDKPF